MAACAPARPPSSSTRWPLRGSRASRVPSATRRLKETPRIPSRFPLREKPQGPREMRPSCCASQKRRRIAGPASKPTRPSVRPGPAARFAAEIIFCARRLPPLSRSVSAVSLPDCPRSACACVLRRPACSAIRASKRPCCARWLSGRSVPLPSPSLPLACAPR